MNFERIPLELRTFRQWIAWRYEKPEQEDRKPIKRPLQPANGWPADITKPEHWGSFEAALRAMQAYNCNGVGFCLSANDPYSFIDLDDTQGDEEALIRQRKIYTEFASYSEVSPSGKGLHIIVKGAIPRGRRRSFIEIYSDQRYMTMTGDVYRDAAIEDRNELLNTLWREMGNGVPIEVYDGKAEQRETDEIIIAKGLGAVNGEKFGKLLKGDWQSLYQSQSEADFAFVDIVAFYTQNREQITRMFRASPLGQRDKAKRPEYMSRMIDRSFDRLLPPIDIEALTKQLELELEASKKAEAAKPLITTPVNNVPEPELPNIDKPQLLREWPPGLLGEIASFIFEASPRPVAEISLAAAIGLMAGICGRAYNISGAGLNQYTLVLAPTGTGKEAANHGISKLLNAVASSGCPLIHDFMGPSTIASGQALRKTLAAKPCFVSILGEFSLLLQQLNTKTANPAQIELRKILLDVYHKSGEGETMNTSVYADAEKNVSIIYSPSFSILGEAVPDKFYENLSEDMVAEGFLPRFTILEYNGPRQPLNKNHVLAVPSMRLVDQLKSLTTFSLASAGLQTGVRVVMPVKATQEAEAFFDEFEKFSTHQINRPGAQEALKHLWNRAHLKNLKLAALVAVGCNYVAPVITLEHAKWANALVLNDVQKLIRKFELGEIGLKGDEGKQERVAKKALLDYVQKDWAWVQKYIQPRSQTSCDMESLWKAKIVPWTFFHKQLFNAAPFRNDRRGATFAIKNVVQALVDRDILREISTNDAVKKYNTTQRLFVISDFAAVRGED